MPSWAQLDLPALAVGLVVGFYWARVVKLVLKTRRTTGRAGNFWPAEALGRALRVVWYPAVVAWIVVPLAVGFGARGGGLDLLYDLPILRWFAAAVALAALVLTMVCWRRMGKSWRMGIDPGETTALVVQGPFAYVRHPIYTLQIVLLAATAAAAPCWIVIGVAVLLACLLQWEAIREEDHMIRTHGETYGRYRAGVGRFVPRSIRPFRA